MGRQASAGTGALSSREFRQRISEERQHDRPVTHRRIRGVLRSIFELLGGFCAGFSILIVMILAFLIYPMFSLRMEMEESGTLMTPPSSMLPETPTYRESDCPLPPVTYDLAFTQSQNANRIAFLSKILEMEPPPSLNILEWVLTPYPMLSPILWQECDDILVLNLVSGLYSDKPELSVYTDGQCGGVSGNISRFRLVADFPETKDENIREYNTVTAKLDAVAEDLVRRMESQENEELRRAFGDDRLYAILAFEWVTDNVRYADGVDDSTHANDIYGALIEGESKCYGVASAMQGLLQRGGIPAFIASGKVIRSADGEGHAWVVTRIDRQWLVLDATGLEPSKDGEDSMTGTSTPTPATVENIAQYHGRWSRCLIPLDSYLILYGYEIAPICERLMGAYEEEVAIAEAEYGLNRPAVVVTTLSR